MKGGSGNPMRKRLLVSLFLLTLLSIFSLTLVSSQTNETQDKIDLAYTCLEDKVDGRCSALTSEEKIFTLLTINECRSELIDDSSNDECWPSGNCKLKTTSQAIIALDNSNSNTDSAEDWLISQNRTASDLIWYLQIESSEATTCSLDYSGLSYSVDVNEDKTLQGNPGPGLTIDSDGYWLRVNSNFYGEDIDVSCSSDFVTGLLFRKPDSSTVHVFHESSSAVSQGTTTEKVVSFCFQEGGSCNYEGSLWAAFVLDSMDVDVSDHLPYLITFAEDNERFLPDAFLYSITEGTDYRASLLSKQIANERWQVSGDRYYDTALALYPFQHETLSEKTNSQEWLLETQDSEGCWNGNVRNTAFILESLWPGGGGSNSGDPTSPTSCLNSGNYCVPEGSCGAQTLDGFFCAGSTSSVCCSAPAQQLTCAELGGNICSSNQVCTGGYEDSNAGDLSGNDFCCVSGVCEVRETVDSLCEQKGGVCRIGSCLSGEEVSSDSCQFAGDSCCVVSSDPVNPPSGGSLAWVWILLICIIILTLAIIFRDKLRHFSLRIKSKFGKSGPSSKGSGPRRPPFSPSFRGPRPGAERRIIPRQPNHGRPQKPRPRSGSNKELDDVLKKLKEMSS